MTGIETTIKEKEMGDRKVSEQIRKRSVSVAAKCE